MKKVPIKIKKRSNIFCINNKFFSILVGLITAGVFCTGMYVFATWDGNKYTPGAVLNPECTPADPSGNCTVIAPYTPGNAATFSSITSSGLTSTRVPFASTGGLLVDSSNLTFDTTNGIIIGNTGDGTILSSNGNLVFGSSKSAGNDETLKFDFETTSNQVAVTSSTGVTLLDLGTIAINSGSYIVGSPLITSVVESGPPGTSPANGSLIVDSGDGGRLYFRYGGAWHYIAQTAGFQIPDFETTDPISGEKIKEGDFVLGMINNTFNDGALHGIWVKWDSVKAQLLAEARGELSTTGQIGTGEIEGVKTETMLDKVTNVLTSLGISIKDGVTNITKLTVGQSTTDIARINKMEMVDSVNGDIYCTWIQNGEWTKVKGECSSLVATEAENQPTTTEQLVTQVQQAVEQAQQSAQQAQDAVEQVQQVQQQVQQVQEQIEQQPQEQTPVPEQPVQLEQAPVVSIVGETLQAVGQTVSEAASTVGEVLQDAVEQVQQVQQQVQQVQEQIEQQPQEQAPAQEQPVQLEQAPVVSIVGETLQAVGQTVSEAASTVGEVLQDAGASMFDGVQRLFNNTKHFTSKAGASLMDGFLNFFNLFNFFK